MPHRLAVGALVQEGGEISPLAIFQVNGGYRSDEVSFGVSREDLLLIQRRL